MVARSSKANRKLSSSLAGVAGEYHTAAELSQRGWIASLTLRNTPGIDIVITDPAASRTRTIQCKTSQGKKKVWLLNEKAEEFNSSSHFYVFVVLGAAGTRPTFHIVPSAVVAYHTTFYHRLWLRTLGRNGWRRRDTPMRKYSDPENEYLERWDLL